MCTIAWLPGLTDLSLVELDHQKFQIIKRESSLITPLPTNVSALPTSTTAPTFEPLWQNIEKLPSKSINLVLDFTYANFGMDTLRRQVERRPSARVAFKLNPLRISHILPQSYLMSTLEVHFFPQEFPLKVQFPSIPARFRWLLSVVPTEKLLQVESLHETIFHQALSGCLQSQLHEQEFLSLSHHLSSTAIQIVRSYSHVLPPSFPLTNLNSSTLHWQDALFPSRTVRSTNWQDITHTMTNLVALWSPLPWTYCVPGAAEQMPHLPICLETLFHEIHSISSIHPISIAPSDPLLLRGRWNGSPIVVPAFRLLFWSIPKNNCEEFKKMLKKMHGVPDGDIHDPGLNGLDYLWNYSPDQAAEMIADPTWSKVVFFRDPLERTLSAYLDKCARFPYMATIRMPVRLKPQYLAIRFPGVRLNINSTFPYPVSFREFLNRIEIATNNEHFLSQCTIMDCSRWIPHMTFIGAINQVKEHTKTMLQALGAWEEFGATGWGASHKAPIFSHLPESSEHFTGARIKLNEYYENPSLVARVRKIHAKDYEALPSYVFNHFPSFAADFWANCQVTTHVNVVMDQGWKLLTYRCVSADHCMKKRVGGDEFEVAVEHDRHQIWAVATDQKNGEYTLEFRPHIDAPISIESPVIMIRLLHSCGQALDIIPLLKKPDPL